MSDSGDQRPLRLLALDGGGVRGLTSLLILRRLMHLIDHENPPKPCDVFDLIAGTSTGGLIAIMLGRLEMDVEAAIEAYTHLSQIVFKPRKRNLIGGHVFQKVVGHATFNHKLLEAAIKDIVRNHTSNEDELLRPLPTSRPVGAMTDDSTSESLGMKCKVFVCASMSNSDTKRLRSYSASGEEHIECTIWQAARATSAAPTFFEPITFPNRATFRDGALRDNNPISQLIDEVAIEFPNETIATIVSLGTGLSRSIELGSGLVSVALACKSISTDTEAKARDFERIYCGEHGPFQDAYFRFDVIRGLENIGLEEWQKQDKMWASTQSYLDGPRERENLRRCAATLRSNSSRLQAPAKTINYINPFYQLDFIDKRPVPYFAPREEQELIRDILDSGKLAGSVRLVSLVGLGGCGKTQLMLRYASSQRHSYGVILWYDARSMGAFEESIFFAASQLGLTQPPTAAKTSGASSELVRFRSGLDTHADLIKKELQRRKQRWLILIDEADDVEMIKLLPRYLPSDPSGSVIISSRRKEAGRLTSFTRGCIEIAGLSTESAQSLLLHHAGLEEPTFEQKKHAKEIVETLGGIALAIELAGRFIPTLDEGLEEYLHLYRSKQREELIRESIGNDEEALHVTGYAHSISTAWKISVNSLQLAQQKFLYILCFLDRTNLTKDLFQRACCRKVYWNEMGKRASLYPAMNCVPEWLFDLFCTPEGNWTDFKFNRSVEKISNLFFLRKETYRGPLLHRSGPIDSTSFTRDGKPPVMLILPQPFHDLGKSFLEKQERQRYGLDAFFVVIHAFRNDVSDAGKPSPDDPLVMHVGRGGVISSRTALEISLEETHRHIISFKDHLIEPLPVFNWSYVKGQITSPRCFNNDLPETRRCEAIMFASSFLPIQLPGKCYGDIDAWWFLIGVTELILANISIGSEQQLKVVGSESSQSMPQKSSRFNKILALGLPLTPSSEHRSTVHKDFEPRDESDPEFKKTWQTRNSQYYTILARASRHCKFHLQGNFSSPSGVHLELYVQTQIAALSVHLANAQLEAAFAHSQDLSTREAIWSKLLYHPHAQEEWFHSDMAREFVIRYGTEEDSIMLDEHVSKLAKSAFAS